MVLLYADNMAFFSNTSEDVEKLMKALKIHAYKTSVNNPKTNIMLVKRQIRRNHAFLTKIDYLKGLERFVEYIKRVPKLTS